ncbi:MAG TPA: diacylglycerol kinase family protein [Candidatus Udaeobacter sp.]
MEPYIIVNPIAGSIVDRDGLLKQLRRLNPRKLRLTRRAGEAESYARDAIRAGSDYVIAAGGDGTLNEVINGIAPPGHMGRICVGIVPLGTANDFARTIGLPASVDDNIDILRAKQTAPIDLVRVRSDWKRYFVNVSAGGFSGLVDEKLTPEIKSTWGPLAYLRSAAAALPELRGYHTNIVFDDGERLMIELYNVIVANGQFVAGGLPIAPQADLRDGLLDVILVPSRSPAKMMLLAAEMLLGNHLSSNAVIFRRAKKISVRSRPGMWFNVDGELIGNDPVVFQILPGALEFVISNR